MPSKADVESTALGTVTDTVIQRDGGPCRCPSFRESHFLLLAIVCFSVGITVPFAHGQTLASSAALSGSVSDQSGARIPNATVTLTNPEKGITRAFKTNDEGNFSFALLPAGTYTLTVEAAGFKTFKVQAITLEVGQSASQGISLTVGAAEQIEVTDTAPLSAGGQCQRRR